MPREKRFELALRRVGKGEAIATVARELNISRSQLNVHVKAVRDKAEADLARVASVLTGTPEILSQTDSSVPVAKTALSNERKRMLSFVEFDQRYFGGLICPDCHVHHEMPAFHKEISDALFTTVPRTLINVPPYHSKSTLATVKGTIYKLVKNPNHRVIIVSASQAFAKTFMHQIKQYLSNPDMYVNCEGNLIDDYGPFINDQTQITQTILYVAGRTTAEKDPSILCIGVGNQIYGRRADEIVFDDIATLDNQRNPVQVLKQLEWIDKEALSRIGRGKAIFVGTRISAGDIYSHLEQREGYKVIKYPCILDEEAKVTLWPEHFPYDNAVERRTEMRPEDWQLVYQNVDTPGLGSSFPAEVLEECKDREHVMGQVEQNWKLYMGLDPAGGGKQSGFTALSLLGYDRDTQDIHIVDTVNVRSMKAYQLKDQILDWTNTYQVAELRVESNGIQSQLVQFNTELMMPLTQKGVRVVPHYCADTETEVLSKRGWLSSTDVGEEDEIFTLNTATNRSEWKPVRFVYRSAYAGPMVSIESRSISALVTPDHTWPVTSQNHPTVLTMKKTTDLNTSDHIPLGRTSTWDPEPKYDDDIVELVGWAVTEGHFRHRDVSITIGQSESANPLKVERLRDLLTRLAGYTNESRQCLAPHFSQMVLFSVRGDLAREVRGIVGGKTLPMEFIMALSSKQRELLLDTLTITDGWTDCGHRRFCSSERSLVDAYSVLQALEGRTTGAATRNFTGNPVPHFTIAEKQASNAYWVNQKSTTVEFAGDIWCPNTENGTFLARRRGKVYFTGNTHGNKWDSQFGVEAIAPWFYNRKVHIPWGNADSQRRMQGLIDQFVSFPMGTVSDQVMAFWFAWLGIKEGVARQPGPMYENRKVPGYVQRRRRVSDPATGKVWRPNDPLMPDFGRGRNDRPEPRKLVNVAGVSVY